MLWGLSGQLKRKVDQGAKPPNIRVVATGHSCRSSPKLVAQILLKPNFEQIELKSRDYSGALLEKFGVYLSKSANFAILTKPTSGTAAVQQIDSAGDSEFKFRTHKR